MTRSLQVMLNLVVLLSLSNARTFLLYHLDRQPFVRAFGDCILDANCTIQYLHVYKTGGTLLETVIPAALGERPYASCCGHTMIERFNNATRRYCDKSFSSYQVAPHIFRDIILQTCAQISDKRRVVLLTYREPVAWTISFVHQLCNKNLKERSPKQLAICKRCNYYSDPNFYDHLVPSRFSEILHGAVFNNTFISDNKTLKFALDTADLSAFLQDLWIYLPATYEKKTKEANFIKSNVEHKGNCNFKAPSELIRKLRPSLKQYRNLNIVLTNSTGRRRSLRPRSTGPSLHHLPPF